MSRWILALLIAGCGVRSAPATGPQLAIQRGSVGQLRVVAFDAHAAMGAILGVPAGMPTTVLALPGGDWLVGFDNVAIARLAPDGTVRWHRDVAISDAVVAGSGLVVAAHYDHAGGPITVIGLRGDGSVAWRVAAGSLTSGPRLVRTPGVTIVSHDGGDVAVDDAGRVRWTHARADHGMSAVSAYVADAGLVVVHAVHASPETAVLPRQRMPMVAELVDPRSGDVRARAELAPDGDAWSLSDVAVRGNRVVVRAEKVVTFAVSRASIAATDAFVEPAPVEVLATAPPLGRDEVAFLDPGPRDARPLELTLVDLALRSVRRVPLLRVSEHGHAQLWQRRRTGDRFTFLGDLTGTLEIADQRVRADVREVQRSMLRDQVFAPVWFFGTFAAR